MIRIKFFLCLAAMVFAGAMFSGCPTDPETGGVADLGNLDGPVRILDGETRYYSLATGQETLSPASPDWDIAFTYDRLIYTNSGDTATALGSNGNGGVRYTGRTDFIAVTLADAVDDNSSAYWDSDLADYQTDKTVYATPSAEEMGAGLPRTLNVMTFIGYGAGNGSQASPFEDYLYNKKQFYRMVPGSGMPPQFEILNQVYIIKHGDGAGYSKIQVTSMEAVATGKGSMRIYQINYAPLP
jgi:hypothetical protein